MKALPLALNLRPATRVLGTKITPAVSHLVQRRFAFTYTTIFLLGKRIPTTLT